MRKEIGSWLVTMFLILQSTVTVFAAQDSVVKAISGYCQSDELYAFIQINDDYDTDSFTVKLQSDAVTAEGERSLVPVMETDTRVHYVLMMDLSDSMRNYADEVDAFVGALMETEKLEACYTIATFGECFEVVKENMTDGNAVKRTLSELEYTEKLTDPYTGIESALIYLDSSSIRSGDLIYLVVITDGELDLGIEDERESQREENKRAKSATEKIQNTPEVIVSTICMAEWDSRAFDVLSEGRGLHEAIDDNQDAAAAGEKVAGYVDSLYRIDFKLSAVSETERFSAALRLRGNALDGQLAMFEVSLESLPDLKLFSGHGRENPNADGQDESGGVEIEGVITDEDGDESENVSGEKPETGEETEPEVESTGEPGREESAGPENEGVDEPGSEDSTELANEGMDESESEDTQGILWIVGICALVIVVGVCLIILVRKQRSGKAELQPGAKKRQNQAAAGSGGITAGGSGLTMKLEVYSGNCVSGRASICLADSIVIGSAPECDLVFCDQDVSPQNSRVFVKDQMIYIADLNSANGTALGGMRIQGQNRLRSGDVISIGNVEFSFKF